MKIEDEDDYIDYIKKSKIKILKKSNFTKQFTLWLETRVT